MLAEQRQLAVVEVPDARRIALVELVALVRAEELAHHVAHKGADEAEWVVARERYKYDEQFDTLQPIDGKITGTLLLSLPFATPSLSSTEAPPFAGRIAKEHMLKSKLPNSVLGKVWKLADVDKDGMLDADEFSLANYLINLKLEGHELPLELPKHLIPPSKKDADAMYPTLE